MSRCPVSGPKSFLAAAILIVVLHGTARSQRAYYQYPAGGAVDGTEIIGPVRQRGADVTLPFSSVAPVRSVFGRSGTVTLLSHDVTVALGYTPPPIGTSTGTARDAAAAIAAETAAQTTANAALPASSSRVPAGAAGAANGAVVAGLNLTWDGSALTYAVPGGPRVCVVTSTACPGLLPNAGAAQPSPGIAVSAALVFDPTTGLYLSDN